MDKAPQKVKKDPKRQEAVRKGRGKYLDQLKEKILIDAKSKHVKTTKYIQDSNTAIFIGPIRCVKSDLVLGFIEKECNIYFHCIIIICQTL